MTSDLPHRDLRSPSIPHLRFRTQRAKYGGAIPTPTGLPYTTAFPGLIHNSDTGSFDLSLRHLLPRAPTKHLSKTQLYRVAQHNVPSLIGKRVNRHNQRTRERDPWNWYGAGRRWEKAAASGEAEVGAWQGELRSGLDGGVFERWCGDELCPMCYFWPEDWDEDSEVVADEVWGPKYGCDGERLSFAEGGRMRRRRTSMSDWRVVRREDVEARWTELGREENGSEMERDGDGWEIVSVNSSPG